MTGTGTLSDPYIIGDVDDLQAIEDDLDAYYELSGNIDASDTTSWNSVGFAPITAFTGQLDGKGYAIDALFIDRSTSAVGLFNTNAGTVKNLGLTNVDITGASVGSIAYKNTGTITECYATGAVVGSGFVAGFVQWNTGTITNCYTRASVTGDGMGFAGGFVQWNNGGTIDDCYSTGAVSNMTVNYGFCQNNDTAEDITNCFWDTETSGVTTSSGGTGKITSDMKIPATFFNAGWNFRTIWSISSWVNNAYPALFQMTTIGRRNIWVEGHYLHYFDERGYEEVCEVKAVTTIDGKIIGGMTDAMDYYDLPLDGGEL